MAHNLTVDYLVFWHAIRALILGHHEFEFLCFFIISFVEPMCKQGYTWGGMLGVCTNIAGSLPNSLNLSRLTIFLVLKTDFGQNLANLERTLLYYPSSWSSGVNFYTKCLAISLDLFVIFYYMSNAFIWDTTL